MMDPVNRIKDLVVALNSVPYDDEAGLDAFLSSVKETIRGVFGEHSHYMTFLGSICFRPVSVFVPAEESVRYWASGKKQLRELLLVMLADPQLKEAGELVAAGDVPAAYEVDEAERIVSRHIGGGVALESLPRVRIDLRDINILDDRVEEYLMGAAAARVKARTATVLFFAGRDEELNLRILQVLDRFDAGTVRMPALFSTGAPMQERLAAYADADMVVVALEEDCWLSLRGMGEQADVSLPAPASCFSLGYLVSRFGRGRVAALYRERPFFRKPTDFFEVFYIPVDKTRMWESELASKLRQNKIRPNE